MLCLGLVYSLFREEEMERLKGEVEELKKSKNFPVAIFALPRFLFLMQLEMKFRPNLERRKENVKSELKKRSGEFCCTVVCLTGSCCLSFQEDVKKALNKIMTKLEKEQKELREYKIREKELNASVTELRAKVEALDCIGIQK